MLLDEQIAGSKCDFKVYKDTSTITVRSKVDGVQNQMTAVGSPKIRELASKVAEEKLNLATPGLRSARMVWIHADTEEPVRDPGNLQKYKEGDLVPVAEFVFQSAV